MKHIYFNIYNNLIKLTRNKILYLNLNNQETFYDRLIFLFFHLAFFINRFKSDFSTNNMQELFDFIIRQIELSIRELGYGDVSINKNMKQYVNLFYSIAENIESLSVKNNINQLDFYKKYINSDKNLDFYVKYFEKYRNFLSNNSLKNFSKDIINHKF